LLLLLSQSNETLRVELKSTADRLLVETNREQDVQRHRVNAEAVIKNMREAMAQCNKENTELVGKLNKQVNIRID